ncbi:MAG: hypothetical protein RQ952_01505 [Thermoproteota archaeon]|jgi:hypothetical protein|nr:hypothetical protein [Thermoproteota archaeon]
MNRFLVIILLAIFLISIYSYDSYSSPISAPVVKGPYLGATDIFYTSDVAIDYATYSKGYISVPVGLQYVSFFAEKININYQAILNFLLNTPVVKIVVNFPQKLLIVGDRFIKLNLTIDLSYDLPYQSYIKITYPSGETSIIQGSGNKILLKDITNVAPLGNAMVTIELYLSGPINTLFTANVQINKIYESAQRSFGVATKHIMYFSDDYKIVYHYVEVPLKYFSKGWDVVYSRFTYPSPYTIVNATVDNNPYSFEDWNKITQGNATTLIKAFPFGQGDINKIIKVTFSTPQSLYYTQTLTSFLTPTDSWSLNETLVLVVINLDITLPSLDPSKYIFNYLILDPNGSVVKSGSFSRSGFKLNSTQKSPLGKVLIANENITIDTSFSTPGLYTIQVLSVSPYSLGFNYTTFLVYDFNIFNPKFNKISNKLVEGSFSLKANIDLNSFNRNFKGGYVMIYDPTSAPKIYTKVFSFGNGLGISSLTIKNKIEHPGTVQNPNPPNLIYFSIFNNSTRTYYISDFKINVRIFDTVSYATVSFSNFEPAYFSPGEIRSYIFVFSIPLTNPYVADQLSKNYNITSFIRSTLTQNSQQLNFSYIGKGVNPSVVHLEREKVWRLEINIGNKTFVSDWLLYDPKNLFSNDILLINEANLNNSTVQFNSNINFNSALQFYEVYGIAYTNDYQVKVSKLISDLVKIEAKLLSGNVIKLSDNKKITIPVLVKNLSNITYVEFNLTVYYNDKAIYVTNATLAPKEEKTLNLNFDSPINNASGYFKIYSSSARMIVGYIFIEEEQNPVKQITGWIGNMFIPIEYVIVFIVALASIIVIYLVSRKLKSR